LLIFFPFLWVITAAPRLGDAQSTKQSKEKLMADKPVI